ncbi:MAG: AsmA-like C-terminal domain-containing protein [Candidatus Rokubacteria bacterium]|nr:AsmA-like C-terminal domain-containing protein [Candidatus Rokubacteria bacterium]
MRRRAPFILLASVLLLVLLVGGGFLYARTRTAREQIRAFVEGALARELNLPVHLGGFWLSLGLGSVELRDLTITDRTTGTPLLAVDRVRVGLALAGLLQGDLRVSAVTIQGPRLSVEDSPTLREILASVVRRFKELSREGEAPGFPVRLERGAVLYRNPAAALSVRVAGLSGRLSWPTPDRPVTAITAETIDLSLGARGVSGVRLEAQARLGREMVEVERLRLDHGGSQLVFTGMIVDPRGLPRVELTTTGELALDQLGSLLGAGWSGRLSLGGKVFGEGFPRNFEGRLGVADGSVAGMPARLVTATVFLRPDRWEVISFAAQAGGGTVRGSGVFEPEEARWRGIARLTDVNLTDLLHVLKRPPALAGRVTGSVEGTGQATHAGRLELRFTLSGRDLRLPDGERRAAGQLEGSLRNGLVTVKRLFLSRGASHLAVRGTADVTTMALALTADATLVDLGRDLWPWEVKGLAGRLTLSGRVGRTLGRPLITGQVSLKNVSFKGWRADLVAGPVEVEPTGLASRALRVSAGRTVATLSGTARLVDPESGWGGWREDLQLALKVDLKGRLEDLTTWSRTDWPVAGPILLQARLGGTPTTLEGGGQLEMRELRFAAERLEALRATLAFKGAELTVSKLTARRGGMPIQAEGAIDVGGRYRFSVLPVSLDLSAIPGVTAFGGRGSVLLRVWGSGQWPKLRVEGELTLAGAGFRDIELGNGTARFTLDDAQWRWDLNLALGVSARGVAPLALSGPLQAEVTATNLDLMPFLPALSERLPFPLAARADGRATFRGALPDLGDLRGQIELTALRGRAGTVSWGSREPARLVLEAGTLRCESLDLVGPGLSVSIRGSVRPGDRTDLVLSGHAPFAIVEPWVPPLADLRGSPEVRLALVGSPGNLKVSGRAELARVEVKLKPVPIWVAVDSGEARFDNDGVQYTILQGAAAGGRLQGQGTSRRDGGSWRHALDFRLENAQLEPIYDQLQSERRWASGDLITHGSLAFETAPGLTALSTLRGRLSVTLEGGSLSRYPALVRIFGLLGTPAQPYRLPDLTRERMPYRQISAQFTLKDGVMETQNLLLDSEVVRVSGVGRVRLVDQSVDLDLGVRPLQVLEQGIRKIPLLGRLLPQEQSLIVTYFDMEGPWADPTISVAPVKSLSQTVVDILLLLIRAPERVISPSR